MSKIKWLARKLEVAHEPGLSNTQLLLTNEDLQPVEPERRLWSWLNYIAFWIADSLNINTWMISSSMIVGGLSWWQSWICVWVGYFIAAGFVCLTGRIGAVYHISFPVTVRASFGIWGSFWPVINRVVMAIIWYGVQGYIGGECVTLMISAIWPSYLHLPNTISPGAGPSGFRSIKFAIYLPSRQSIRPLLRSLSLHGPYPGPDGIGPIIHQPNTVHGSDLSWAVVKGIMNCIGNFAALIMNDPDFSRFARTPKDALWSQLLTIPIGFGITSFIGIIVSSSAAVIYGKLVWNPLDLLQMFLDGASSGQRFGIFVIALGFTLAQLGTNISANSVSAGTDLTALLPRYLNIRRGSYICAAISLAICPWKLASSSNQFTTYLSAYSLFLSAIAGVMICDYYIVRRGYLDVKALYSIGKTDPYFYTYGFSWQAYAAYLSGILINIVGFVGAVGPTVPIGATYIYNVNYFAGVIVAGGMYFILTKLFPIPATSATWNEVDIDTEHFSVAYEGQAVDEESRGDYVKSFDESFPPDDQKGLSAASNKV
ncbi:Uracil permease [Penicillium chermesinum]|nr:Uracil permease [Penicillium chermesinum]